MKLEFDDYLALTQLYADYASAVDCADWDGWCEFFTDDCVYNLMPRENHERGLPLATLSFESKGMLKDRAYAIRETLFHDPYYQRHVIGVPRVLRDRGQRDRSRSKLRRVSHQALRVDAGVQCRALPGHGAAHGCRVEVRRQAVRV